MEINRDIRLSIGALLLFQLLISFGAIGLLDRMAPAIHRILDENVVSIDSAQEMLTLLAMDSEPLEERKADFIVAIARAREKAHEKNELSYIDRISGSFDAALWGDPKAKNETIMALKELSTVNQKAMVRADEHARNLGLAASWAIVFLGFTGFLVCLFVLKRLLSRIAEPVAGLCQTLQAWRKGDFLRRCKSNEGVLELRNALTIVNELLDDHIAPTSRSRNGDTSQDKAVIVHFLEQQPHPAFVINEKSGIVAANSRGIALLSRKDGAAMRQDLVRACKGTAIPAIKDTTAIKNSENWLCTLTSE